MRYRAVLLALCCAMLGWLPEARANLLPNLYLFSTRPPPVPLAMGSVLFHFYQDDYPATLQEALYVEQRFGTNTPGRDQLLLAKGSAALGLGMLSQARIWLAQVDAKHLPVNALPRLHLAMARVAFLDGDDILASQFLGELSPELDARPDVNFLRVELARRAGDLRAMSAALSKLPANDPLWFFGWHNYAVAARDQHALDIAANAFDHVAGAEPHDALGQDIVVRAALQGALLRYEQGDVPGAIKRLDAIPVAGTYGRVALAQRAEVALARTDYGTAAKVFTSLAGEPSSGRWDAHRVDALIGVSFALERTAGGATALPRYSAAASQLGERLQALDGLNHSLDDHAWLGLLAEVDRGLPGSDATRLRALDGNFSGVDWLAWLADRDTQRHLKGWRRLGEMTQRVAVLRESAAALGQAAAEQERRVALANDRMQGSAIAARLQQDAATLTRTVDQLAALRTPPDATKPGAYQRWLIALATPAEAVQLKQLAHLQTVATSADKPELLARIARLNGVVGWNIADDVAARLWGQEKTRRALSLRRDALAARAARITTAEAERAAQTGAAAKVEAFRADLGVIETRAKLLTDERARALTERLRERIRKDRDDTRKQLTYAQLAVARLTDQLLTSKRSVP